MHPMLNVLAVLIASWLNEQQQNVIEYIREENRVLRKQLGGKRIRLNAADTQAEKAEDGI